MDFTCVIPHHQSLRVCCAVLVLLAAVDRCAPSSESMKDEERVISEGSKVMSWLKAAGGGIHEFFAGDHNVFNRAEHLWREISSNAAVEAASTKLREKLADISAGRTYAKLSSSQTWRIYLAIWANCSVFFIIYTILIVRAVRLKRVGRDKMRKREILVEGLRRRGKHRRLRNPFKRRKVEEEESSSSFPSAENTARFSEEIEEEPPIQLVERRIQSTRNLRDLDFASPAKGEEDSVRAVSAMG